MMTPLELCEPLFLFVCKINRSKRKGGPAFEAAQLRAEVDRILRTMVQQSTTERDLPKQFNQLKPVLLAFVDGMAAQALPGKWTNMSGPGQSGEEFFFKELEVTIADDSPPARQRLMVFYTCLGLGYGEWRKGPDEARQWSDKINQVAGLLQDFMDLDERRKICTSAYEHTDTRLLEPALAQRMTSLAIVLVGLLVIAFVANAMLYRQKTRGLNEMMNSVIGHSTAEQPAKAG